MVSQASRSMRDQDRVARLGDWFRLRHDAKAIQGTHGAAPLGTTTPEPRGLMPVHLTFH